ncbi:DUF5405 family protein [Pantoea eucalypti]|uniref:DUF5405 family protein n=1 Tax=Pantoea eucalypti TaxID=470933 RepID=UPI00099AE444|nr:DUF5405 family protein [Pantoea eucalypti]SKA19278.1 hypothetical protein SAMN03097723_3513 [Pantoea eucalypti]
MHIEIGEKYTVEGGANDFILYVKSIVKHGKTAGQETQQRLGYFSKLEHLIRALINHEIRTGEAKTLQEMQDQITYISIWCEKAFAEVEHV